MLETIFQATAWGFASITIIVLAGILVLFFVLRFVKSYKEISVGQLKLSKESASEGRIIDERRGIRCAYAADILDAARKTAELRVRVNNIYKEVLKEQVRQGNEKLDDAVHIMQHQFIKEINSKTNGSLPFIQHKDYALFELIRDAILPRIQAYIKYRFEDNHYAFYTAEAQLEYVIERKKVLLRNVTELLTQYWCCADVSRMEMTAINRAFISQYEVIISSIFNEAFALAREGYRKIQGAEEEYRAFIASLTGERTDADAVLSDKETGRIHA